MNLKQALTECQHDLSWGIWAERLNGEFTPESYARYGQNFRMFTASQDGLEYVCSVDFPERMFNAWSAINTIPKYTFYDKYYTCVSQINTEWNDPKFLDYMIEVLNS